MIVPKYDGDKDKWIGETVKFLEELIRNVKASSFTRPASLFIDVTQDPWDLLLTDEQSTAIIGTIDPDTFVVTLI